MQNYISVNAKYYKSKQIHQIYSHNSRLSSIDYLLESKDIKYKNLNYSINPRNSLVDNFQEQLNLKIKDQKARGYTPPKNSNSNDIIDMVVSLSQEQALYYLNQDNGEELIMQGYKSFLVNIEKEYGFKGLEINLHTDEGHISTDGTVQYNIHAHLIFLNYDFEKSKTVLRTLQSKDWSNMQDLAAKSFTTNNLNFIRGESKQSTKKEHLERNDFILKSQTDKLKENSIKYHNQLARLEENKKEYNQQIKLLNTIKNDIKSQRAEFKRDTTEYKELTIKYKQAQGNEKSIREESRVLSSQIKLLKDENTTLENSLKSIDNKITTNTIKNQELENKNKTLETKISKSNSEFQDNIDKSLKTIKDNALTLNFANDKFDKIITTELKKQAKYPIEIKENKKLKDDILSAKVEIDNLASRLNTAESKLYATNRTTTDKDTTINKLSKEVNELQTKNIELSYEVEEYKSNIDKLVSIIKGITKFASSSIQDIFTKFLPNNDEHDNSHHTNIHR